MCLVVYLYPSRCRYRVLGAGLSTHICWGLWLLLSIDHTLPESLELLYNMWRP
ncbi:hypothetical protein BDV19DRAFT_356005 [Aspergillus venezuelensis]